MLSTSTTANALIELVATLPANSLRLPKAQSMHEVASHPEKAPVKGEMPAKDALFVSIAQEGDKSREGVKDSPKQPGVPAQPKAPPVEPRAAQRVQILNGFFAAQNRLLADTGPRLEIAAANIVLGNNTLTTQREAVTTSKAAVDTALKAVNHPPFTAFCTRIDTACAPFLSSLTANRPALNDREILADFRQRLATATGRPVEQIVVPPGGITRPYIEALKLGAKVDFCRTEYQQLEFRAFAVMGWLGDRSSGTITFNANVPEHARPRITAMTNAVDLRNRAIDVAKDQHWYIGPTRYDEIRRSFPTMTRLAAVVTANGNLNAAQNALQSTNTIVGRIALTEQRNWINPAHSQYNATYANLHNEYRRKFTQALTTTNKQLEAAGFPPISPGVIKNR